MVMKMKIGSTFCKLYCRQKKLFRCNCECEIGLSTSSNGSDVTSIFLSTTK